MTTTSAETAAVAARQDWTRQREQNVRAPYGFLALVATAWLDEAEREIDTVPGRWSATPRGRVRVSAVAADGLLLADEPLAGSADLRPDLDPAPQILTHGARRLVPIVRELDGTRRTLAVSAASAGLSASFGDGTNGPDTFGFRFLSLPEPDATGRTAVDFNRAHLPPCAFTDHSLCPLPPVGNRLPVAIAAGERQSRFGR